MTTAATENGLESLIMRHMTGTDGFAPLAAADGVAETPFPTGGSGWPDSSAAPLIRLMIRCTSA